MGTGIAKVDMFPSARLGRPKFMQMNTTMVQRSRGGVQERKACVEMLQYLVRTCANVCMQPADCSCRALVLSQTQTF